MDRINRRAFLHSSVAAAGLTTSSLLLPTSLVARPQALVVRVKDPTFRSESGFLTKPLAAALDRAVVRLTGAKDADAAWKSLFTPRDIVGLKVNCLAGPGLSTHPEVVQAIIAGLRRAGVPDGNIIVWERFSIELERAGFKLQKSPGAARIDGIDGQYEPDITFSGEIGSCFTPIVTRLCTALINVPVLKDHRLAGIGVGMKNFYGAIHNPNKYHENLCDPFVADVCNADPIRNKLRLIVCDALNGQYDGGPTWRPQRQWQENALLVASDPVALDAVAGQIIDEQRRQHNLPALAEDKRDPTWLPYARQLGLGENRLDRIEVTSA